MKQKKEVEIKGIFLAVTLLFLGFLIVPLCRLFYKIGRASCRERV